MIDSLISIFFSLIEQRKKVESKSNKNEKIKNINKHYMEVSIKTADWFSFVLTFYVKPFLYALSS